MPSDLVSVEGLGLDPEVAVMAQLLGPVVHCCRRLGNVVGRSIFVIGQGPAGLTLTRMVRKMGAGTIVTADLVEERLDASLRFGADRALHGRSDLLEEARDETGGELFDLVIEAVGDQETVSIAPMLAKKMGMVVFFGLPGEDTTLTPRLFFGKQLHITTSEYPQPEDFEHALGLMASGYIDMTPMVTHMLPFGNVQEGFDLADTRRDGVLRVVLNMEE
jgi:L-idonate 5-dehydrogenase